MSSHISYIGAYIKLPILNKYQDPSKNKDFISEDQFVKFEFEQSNSEESENYYHTYDYLFSMNKELTSFIDEVEETQEKEINVEEIKKAKDKFIKDTQDIRKNFKKSFNIDLEVKYGAVFYEA